MNLWRRYREKKAKKEADLQERSDKQKERYKERIASQEALMLSKPCPFREDHKCNDQCVHFREGSVYWRPTSHPGFSGYWTYKLSHCKLWK